MNPKDLPKRKRGAWVEKSKQFVRAFRKELTVYQRVLRDARTPKIAKVFLGLAIGYLCLPFDLIPDFIPVLGLLDDVIIVPGLICAALRFVPPELIVEHRERVSEDDSATM